MVVLWNGCGFTQVLSNKRWLGCLGKENPGSGGECAQCSAPRNCFLSGLGHAHLTCKSSDRRVHDLWARFLLVRSNWCTKIIIIASLISARKGLLREKHMINCTCHSTLKSFACHFRGSNAYTGSRPNSLLPLACAAHRENRCTRTKCWESRIRSVGLATFKLRHAAVAACSRAFWNVSRYASHIHCVRCEVQCPLLTQVKFDLCIKNIWSLQMASTASAFCGACSMLRLSANGCSSNGFPRLAFHAVHTNFHIPPTYHHIESKNIKPPAAAAKYIFGKQAGKACKRISCVWDLSIVWDDEFCLLPSSATGTNTLWSLTTFVHIY